MSSLALAKEVFANRLYFSFSPDAALYVAVC